MKIMKNYFYNLLYEIAALVVPLVLTPYVSRVLQVEGVGKYSVSVAIANYFILFGMLGINMYGNRQIAYVRDNPNEMRLTFWSINVLRIISMGVAIVAYIGFVCFTIPSDKKLLYFVQLFTISASLVDISWFFTGIENFKKTSIRNIIVKFLGVGLVLVFVKTRADLVTYSAILGSTTFLGQLVLWVSLPKQIRRLQFRWTDVRIHAVKTVHLWLPSVAVQIYASLDKIMLGYLAGDEQAGLYESSQKLIKMVSTISTSFTTATLPRMSNLYTNGDEKAFKTVAKRSILFLTFLSVPLAFGTVGIRKTLVPWFFGPGYEEIIFLLPISSWLLVSLAWSSFFGNQILVACNREKQYTRAIFADLIVNVVLNFSLIPILGAKGALIASVCAEVVGTLIMMYFAKKLFNICLPIEALRYFFAGSCMCIFVSMVGYYLPAKIVSTGVQIVVGMCVYFGILMAMKDDVLFEGLATANKLRKRFFSRER